MENKKQIKLDQSDENALAQMVGSGANYVKVLKKILNESIEDLIDVRNIDQKSNMGLQTYSRQLAAEKLIEIRDLIFPDQAEVRATTKKSGAEDESKWR